MLIHNATALGPGQLNASSFSAFSSAAQSCSRRRRSQSSRAQTAGYLARAMLRAAAAGTENSAQSSAATKSPLTPNAPAHRPSPISDISPNTSPGPSHSTPSSPPPPRRGRRSSTRPAATATTRSAEDEQGAMTVPAMACVVCDPRDQQEE